MWARLCLCVCLAYAAAAFDDYTHTAQYADYNAYDVTSDYGHNVNDYGHNVNELRDYGYDVAGYGAHSYDYISPNAMRRNAKSYTPKRRYQTVPVVIKKKKQKKRKTLSTQHGFYIPGGTQMYGKFKDLHSCVKACEITPTCFAGDFNPWLGKCFFHGNVTACGSMLAHKAITHFKKVPCSVLGSPRGIVVLGTSVVGGIELKKISSLQDCIKACTSAGGGVASSTVNFQPENQVCCGINYDFANHKCYILPCPANIVLLNMLFCKTAPLPIGEPLNSIPNPTTISVTICPMT